MSDKTKYAYLAGIIDGEGCLTIEAGTKGTVINYNSIIVVASTDERLIRWLHQNFGGNWYKSGRHIPNCKPAFIWRFLRHSEIELLLLAVLPYLIIKRDQALILLQFVRLLRTSNHAKREELFQKIKVLNKRGTDSVETNTQDMDILPMKIESEHIGDYVSGPAVMQVTQ